MTQDQFTSGGYEEWFQDDGTGSNGSDEKSFEKKFQDASGQSNLLARIDYRESLDLSGSKP